jgi:hypothetical protein
MPPIPASTSPRQSFSWRVCLKTRFIQTQIAASFGSVEAKLIGRPLFEVIGIRAILTERLFREILIGLCFQELSGDYKVKRRCEELVPNVIAALDCPTQWRSFASAKSSLKKARSNSNHGYPGRFCGTPSRTHNLMAVLEILHQSSSQAFALLACEARACWMSFRRKSFRRSHNRDMSGCDQRPAGWRGTSCHR